MSDKVKLTFADGTTHQIEVDAGTGNATAEAEAIINRTGRYASGWIGATQSKWLNLGTVVSVEVQQESDPLFAHA